MRHAPTRSWVEGKAPGQVPVKGIRPTNGPSRDVRSEVYTPIVVVRAEDGLYYIVDGNHRFFRKLVRGDYADTIPAWVFVEGDQPRIHGTPLPQHVREWKAGKITLAQLSIMAKNAYEGMREKVEELLRAYRVVDRGETRPAKPAHATRLLSP